MPIKWSAVKVSEAMDEVEQLLNSITPTLWQIREKAREIKAIPHLPGYIDQPTSTMAWKVENFKDYMKGYIDRIRQSIPDGAMEEEKRSTRHGRTQSLI